MGKAKLTVRTTDLGSVIIDCGDKHYNKGVTPGLAVCHAMGGVMTTLVA